MSSGTQVDLDWAGTDAGQSGASAPPASASNTGATGGAYLTDEEILGIESHATNGGFGGGARQGTDGGASNDTQLGGITDVNRTVELRTDENPQAEARATGGMPSWMAAAAADPKHGGEAQQLWREHQEFRAAFASSEEARAIKELLPGGVKDVLSLREATQSVERIDAALFSGDARAQSEVVAELARANPAAFRSMFAEAARVLAGMGKSASNYSEGSDAAADGPTLRKDGEGWGTQNQIQNQNQNQDQNQNQNQNQNQIQNQTGNRNQNRGDIGNESRVTNHQSPVTSQESPHFDPAAYASFERATNDAVARDVRGAIGDTLARVMPDGVADGAARRMGEDIFNEVHRALAADRTLSEQVAGVLRERRFGGAEQQRVASLLAGRAKQLVPSVARRVIGEWTSSVLNTARSKAARQASAASRVDIAAAGGSLDSMPLRQMPAREVNYASMSDEEILGI
jgi:hypothetical protein